MMAKLVQQTVLKFAAVFFSLPLSFLSEMIAAFLSYHQSELS